MCLLGTTGGAMQNVLHVIGEILALCVGIAWIAMFVIFVLCLWYGEWMLAFIALWLMALFGAWHKHNEAEREDEQWRRYQLRQFTERKACRD